jgi:hypothetical protein
MIAPPDPRLHGKVKIEQVRAPEDGGDSGAHLISRCAADIAPKRIDFLWQNRIARGKHTAFAGEPGEGKSQLSINIAATISRGREWPCNEGCAPVGNVIILNAEDGADDTVVPRLMAAAADLARMHLISSVVQRDGKGHRTFNLQSDLALLEREITRIGNVVLVIIDPISSYMGKTDSHKNAEVRGALEPLNEIAARLNVAVVSITHFSKSGTGHNSKALHRLIGSIAFVAAPRAVFAVIEDPDNKGRMLFLSTKNNMAAKPQGLAYRLVQTFVDGKAGESILASYVHWDNAPVTMSADEALRATDGGGDKTALAEAVEFLQDLLADGPIPQKDVKQHSDSAGHSWATTKRAKKALGVRAERKAETGDGLAAAGRWYWSLANTSAAPKVLRSSYEAHNSNVSTLGKLEPLRSAGSPEGAPTAEARQVPQATPRPPTALPASDLWKGLDIPPFLRRDRHGPPILNPDGNDLGDPQ